MTDAVQVETQARQIGWVPQEEFRGDPGKWVDATEFVRRGETVMPLLKASNDRLQREINATKEELKATKQLFEASQEAISELKKFHTEDTKRQVQEAKKDLKAKLVEAREAGDHGLAVDIEDELSDIRLAEAEANRAAKAPAPAPAPAALKEPVKPDAETAAWMKANPWFGTDKRKTSLTFAIAQELREANDPLTGAAFYTKAANEAEAILNPAVKHSKVEGSGASNYEGGSGGGGGSKRTFRDLPADAKQVCDRQEAKMVGAGRAFKDQAAWRSHYVSHYFAGEE